MYARDDQGYREAIEQSDLVLPGQKDILEAAGITDSRSIRETASQTFLRLWLKYLHRNHCRVYLLVETDEEVDALTGCLTEEYRGIAIVGAAKVAPGTEADDMLVNAINGSEVDCVLSALSVPLQEDFIAKNRNLLDVRVWIGVGKKIFSPRKPGFGQGKIAKYLLNHIFRREMEKNKLKMKS